MSVTAEEALAGGVAPPLVLWRERLMAETLTPQNSSVSHLACIIEPMADVDRAIGQVARRQHGLLTREQALEVGLSRATWYRQLDRGRLQLVHPGVARIAGSLVTAEQRILAAVLACGAGALASHSSAALLWGVELADWEVEVISRRPGRPSLVGVTVHRPRDVLGLRPVRRSGIPVADPLRLILDLGAVRPESDVEATLDKLVVRGVITVAGARAVLARHGRRGRSGTAALRSVLDRWAFGAGRPDSTAEAEAARWLATAGAGAPAVHHRVERYELDFAWPELAVAVEVDGWEVHGRREAFEDDRLRDLRLHALGWTVLHVTARSVERRTPAVLDHVAAVLRARSVA